MSSPRENILRKTSQTLVLIAGVLICASALTARSSARVMLAVNHEADAIVLATLWTQSSAECQALRLQAYDLAQLRLKQAMAEPATDQRKPAVVVDIDETVLDNSPMNAYLAMTDGRWNLELWDEWCHDAVAKPIPGAKAFLSLADQLGVTIFYVSNRSVDVLESTLKNLRAEGFPQAQASQLYLMTDDAGKQPRRLQIEKDYRILLLVGDNLTDFNDVFDRKSPDERSATVAQLSQKFGSRYIMLPNAMYGDWDSAALSYQRGLDFEQAQNLRRTALRPWRRGHVLSGHDE